MRWMLGVAGAALLVLVGCGEDPDGGPFEGDTDGGGGGSETMSGGNGGNGGTDAVGGGSTGGTSGGGGAVGAPLPDDASIFGSKVTGMYIFRSAYVTTTGSPPVITSVVNAHEPGVRDAVFEAGHRPYWIASCGQDENGQSYGCARFVSSEEHFGVATGFTVMTGDRPSMVTVFKMNDLDNQVAVPFQLAHDTQSTFMNTPEVRSGQGIWRYNGHFVDTPHNRDFGAPDLALHVHEQYLITDRHAIFDGVTQGQGQISAGAGVSAPLNIVSLGRRAPFEYASCDMFEAIVIDQPTLAEASSYRSIRVRAEYPTIALP